MNLEEPEICPMGYSIGENGLTIGWDTAISSGDWKELSGKSVSINIETLIRNAMHANKGTDPSQPNLVSRILEDIDLFRSYLDDIHGATMNIYRVRYDSMPIAKLPNYRIPKTDKQIADHELIVSAVKALRDSIDKVYDQYIASESDYLISHILFDMVNTSHSTKLIETHTGRIRTRSECSEKLNLTDEEKLVIPFNGITYLIYGDKKLLNKNKSIASKLLKVLYKGNITTLSTESRFSMCIKNNDPLLHKFIKGVLK